MADAFSTRPLGSTLVLFDVDGTLTPARQTASPDMLKALQDLRKKVVIGFVGGSDLVKIREQLQVTQGANENGLTAYRSGQELQSQSFIKHLGEEKFKKLVNFCLREISELDIPIKRIDERNEFEKYDQTAKVRSKLVDKLKKEFSDYGLTFSIGGQISFDVFPNGWDKTYALRHVENLGFKEIHFFGDKTYQGGNDYEIFQDSRTIGHSVTCPDDTIEVCGGCSLSNGRATKSEGISIEFLRFLRHHQIDIQNHMRQGHVKSFQATYGHPR